jgi:FdhD protein
VTKHNLIATTPISEVAITRWHDNKSTVTTDKVAEEVPIAMIYNGISHAVMLATPQDLADFALGFSLSEGILQHKSQLYDVEIVVQTNGVELNMDVASIAFAQLKQYRRNLTGRTGCGLCGAESLQDALRLALLTASNHDKKSLDMNSKYTDGAWQPPPESILQSTDIGPDTQSSLKQSSQFKVSAAAIQSAFHALQLQQVLQQATGATHACAWVNASGDVKLVREDVGRHNAMDKLIGALAKTSGAENGFVLTSSRASVEMVQKVALAGHTTLAAISAPTGLAIRVAQQFGVTLVGFLRDNSFVVYSHPQRITF